MIGQQVGQQLDDNKLALEANGWSPEQKNKAQGRVAVGDPSPMLQWRSSSRRRVPKQIEDVMGQGCDDFDGKGG